VHHQKIIEKQKQWYQWITNHTTGDQIPVSSLKFPNNDPTPDILPTNNHDSTITINNTTMLLSTTECRTAHKSNHVTITFDSSLAWWWQCPQELLEWEDPISATPWTLKARMGLLAPSICAPQPLAPNFFQSWHYLVSHWRAHLPKLVACLPSAEHAWEQHSCLHAAMHGAIDDFQPVDLWSQWDYHSPWPHYQIDPGTACSIDSHS